MCRHFTYGRCRKAYCQYSHAVDEYGLSDPAKLDWNSMDALNIPFGEPFDAKKTFVGNNMYAKTVGPIVNTRDTRY